MQTAIQNAADAPIHQRRTHKRYDYSAPCLIQRENQTLAANLRNISLGGANLILEQLGAMAVGKTVTLAISDFTPISAVVRWSEGSAYGVQFLSPGEKHTEISELIARLEAGSKPS